MKCTGAELGNMNIQKKSGRFKSNGSGNTSVSETELDPFGPGKS